MNKKERDLFRFQELYYILTAISLIQIGPLVALNVSRESVNDKKSNWNKKKNQQIQDIQI